MRNQRRKRFLRRSGQGLGNTAAPSDPKIQAMLVLVKLD